MSDQYPRKIVVAPNFPYTNEWSVWDRKLHCVRGYYLTREQAESAAAQLELDI